RYPACGCLGRRPFTAASAPGQGKDPPLGGAPTPQCRAPFNAAPIPGMPAVDDAADRLEAETGSVWLGRDMSQCLGRGHQQLRLRSVTRVTFLYPVGCRSVRLAATTSSRSNDRRHDEAATLRQSELGTQ